MCVCFFFCGTYSTKGTKGEGRGGKREEREREDGRGALLIFGLALEKSVFVSVAVPSTLSCSCFFDALNDSTQRPPQCGGVAEHRLGENDVTLFRSQNNRKKKEEK